MRASFPIFSLVLFLSPLFSFAQKDIKEKDYIIVGNIIPVGNEKTKPHIILRELDFQKGDTIQKNDLEQTIIRNQNKVFNTELFVTVNFVLPDSGRTVQSVYIQVTERLYVFIFPVFELADRNFNEWISDRSAESDRLDYGLRVYLENLRGRNERLKTVLQWGFNNKYEVEYSIPYINKGLKTGMSISASYIRNKQVAFNTVDNKLAYFEGDSYQRKRFNTGVYFTRRSEFYETHQYGLYYRDHSISDTLAKLNELYFLDGRTKQRYFELSYMYNYDKRDLRNYPLNGFQVIFESTKLGLGVFNDINQWENYLTISLFDEFKKNFSISTQFKGKVSFPKSQPFYNYKALGYKETLVRGYELYVIDGEHYVLSKNEFRKQIFGHTFNVGLMPRQFRKIPVAIYLKAYFDYGAVFNDFYQGTNGSMMNRLIYGGGAGIDIVTYYGYVFRLEYSTNDFGEAGFFFHFESAF